MKQLRIGGVLVCSVLALATTTAAAQETSPPGQDDPVITIDGTKNPELIPNWCAWQAAFQFMAAPATHDVPIPTIMFPVTTEAQRALLRKEALAVAGQEQQIYAVATKLLDGLNEANRAERSEQMDALNMKIRKVSLDARDRVLEALSPAGQGALREFANSMRKGYTVILLKSKLAQFRLPE